MVPVSFLEIDSVSRVFRHRASVVVTCSGVTELNSFLSIATSMHLLITILTALLGLVVCAKLMS